MRVSNAYQAGLALAVLAGTLLVAGCQRTPPPDMGKSTSPAPVAVPVPRVPAPLPAQPVLKSLNANELVWGDPEHADSRLVRLVFDNGTTAELRVKLADNVEFLVPSRQRKIVFTHVGPIQFRVSDPDLPDEQSFETVAEEQDVCVYNHQSAWDYKYAELGYSTIPVLDGSEPGRTTLVGPLFFRAHDIDYLFEPAPSSVTVTTYGGFGSTSKRSLEHAAPEPTAGRTVRRASLGEKDGLHVVTENEQSIHVHRHASRADEVRRTLQIDNASPGESARSLRIGLEETLLAELPVDATLRLTLPPGRFPLTAANAEGTQVDVQAIEPEHAGRYVWCPGGQRAYTIDFKIFSISAFGLGGPQEKPPVTCRGLRFFRCAAPLMFQEFPTTYSLPGNQWEARVARLSPGEAVDSRDALATDWTALQERARNDLAPDVFKRFQQETALGEQAPPTDCDLWLAEAWLAFERADDTAVAGRLDDLLEFRPDRALAHKLYGLSAARQGRVDEALRHLKAATSQAESLTAELATKIEDLERQAEEQRAARQKEAEQKAEEQKLTEKPSDSPAAQR